MTLQAESPPYANGQDSRGEFASALLQALRATPRSIAPKFFYDAAGSALFDRICALDEYYLTRTETALLQRHAPEMAECIGAGADLIEFGAGSLHKIRLLLDALPTLARFVPIDISAAHLQAQVRRLQQDYPTLPITPLVADFTRSIRLPASPAGTRQRVGFFPGSSIGNFSPLEACEFLATAAQLLRGGGLLIGVDLIKDPALLHRAYNDAAGVTAAFNLNLLARANRELGADFDLGAFHHYAYYQPQLQRIEMHLLSARRQTVRLCGERFEFSPGASLHTENSCKYSVEGFQALARQAGWQPGPVWCDAAGLFSVHWLAAPSASARHSV
ncbi:MAG: L-histidine N(alpha)-methyltransferase [Leptothrix sp. (in: b-proteobacteria)]